MRVMDDNQDALREFVRSWLAKQGMDTRELAKRARVSESTIYGFLSGGRKIGYASLTKIARVIGEAPTRLFELGGLDVTESLSDEDASREINAIIARMPHAKRRAAIKVLYALANDIDDADLSTDRPGRAKPSPRKAQA